MSYIGNEPIVSATRTITEITATAGQTVFVANGGYTVGYIDVFLNGAQLQTVDFTATNGSSITLTEAAQVGDVLKLVAWGTFQTSSALTANNPSYTGTLTGGTGVVNIGSGQVYKDASGNVGIGTSSPSSLVDANFSTNGLDSIALRNNSAGTSARARIRIGNDFSANQFIIDGYGSNHSTKPNFVELFNVLTAPLVLGTNNTERMRIDSSGNFQTFCVNAMRPAYDCRAWVNFNGTGTVAIRASGNVSSITDNGAGDYTVNFTTAMPDANYASSVSAGQSGGNQQSGINMFENNARAAVSPTTSAFRFTTFAGGAFVDHAQVLVSVFR